MDTGPADSHAFVRCTPMLQCMGDQKQYILLHKYPFLKIAAALGHLIAGHLSSSTEDLRDIVFLLAPRGSSFKKALKHTGGAVGRRGQGGRATS